MHPITDTVLTSGVESPRFAAYSYNYRPIPKEELAQPGRMERRETAHFFERWFSHDGIAFARRRALERDRSSDEQRKEFDLWCEALNLRLYKFLVFMP